MKIACSLYRIYVTLVVFLTVSTLSLRAQTTPRNAKDVLGYGFDVRYIDALNWAASSKGSLLIKDGVNTFKVARDSSVTFHFVTNAHEFEKELLKADTISSPFRAENSSAHYRGFDQNRNNDVLVVYSQKRIPVIRKSLKSNTKKTLDSALVEDFKRLGRDITAEGFINRYGTHYAQEVVYGGVFLKQNLIQKDDFIYSPYDEQTFKKKVIEDIIASHRDKDDPDPYISSGKSKTFTIGGNVSASWHEDWSSSVEQHMVPIEVSLQTYSQLLSSVSIPNITEKEKKIKLLDSVIEVATHKARLNVKAIQKNDFFKKYSLRFKQSLTSLVKKSSGKETGDSDAYTGDLFFGGFTKDEAILKTAPLIDRGGIRLETLITDEKITLNKEILITAKPEDLQNGYVSVWDDTKKLVKSNDRKRLRVSGPEAAKTRYREALVRDVKKNVEITTIDGDVYEVEYLLSLEKEKSILENNRQDINNALVTELITAASTGNLEALKSLFEKNTNRRISGLINSIITTKGSNEMLNYVLDNKVIPSVEDLELLFLKEYYDEHKILILLERGTAFKNNMLYKAVAYKSDKIIYALLREGAIPKNNDLAFALDQYYYPTVKALMSVDFETFTAGKNELLLATENNDPALAQKFVTLGATADAYILEKTLLQENDKLTNVVVPVTETSSASLEVVAKQDNTQLFNYFINKRARLENNNVVEIATNNNNIKILDLALKNGGNVDEALNYAIRSKNKDAIEISLKNKAQPDPVFAYATITEDAQLFNDALNIYGGTPTIALNAAIQENNIPFAKSVIANKKESINTSESMALAVSKDNLDMVKLLVVNEGNPTEGIREAIKIASEPITKYLISQGAETIDPLLIQNAVKQENLALSKILVEQGKSDVNNAIVDASNTGNTEITKYLLDKGAKPNDALLSAMETENEDVILLLLERSTDSLQSSYLFSAARKGNLKVLNKLLDEGMDPSFAIENAIRYKKEDVLVLLLNRGGIPEHRHLQTAIDYNFIEGIALLINHSAIDINSPFINGEYPIHSIASIANLSDRNYILTLFLEKKINLNAQNDKKNTILHLLALQNESDDVSITQILKAGADPTIKNYLRKTPIDLAEDRSLRSLLKKYARQK